MVLHRTCWSCGSPFMSTVIRILPAPTRLSGLRWQTPCLSFLQIVCATSQKVPDVEWVLVNIYRINEYVDITFIPSLLSCFQPDNSNRYHDICFVTCPHVGVLILEAPPFQDVLFSARDPLHIGSSGHVFCEPSFPFVFFFFFPSHFSYMSSFSFLPGWLVLLSACSRLSVSLKGEWRKSDLGSSGWVSSPITKHVNRWAGGTCSHCIRCQQSRHTNGRWNGIKISTVFLQYYSRVCDSPHLSNQWKHTIIYKLSFHLYFYCQS